jgi:alkylated DNA repair dioxygenase AlkB
VTKDEEGVTNITSNPELDHIKEELAAQRAKQEALEAQLVTVITKQDNMSAKQDEISSYLKTIISLLQPKP